MQPRTITLLILLMLAAVGLRLAGITFDSLWLDEGYQSMADAVGQRLPDFTALNGEPYLFKFGPPQPLDTVLANFRAVDPLCPPLYAVLLNRWMALFGQGDLAVRLPSTLLSLGQLAVVVFMALRFFGKRAALFAGILVAVSPFDIYYAQEARMYTLTTFMAALSSAALLALLTARSLKGATLAWLPVYVGATWALINSHYTGLFIPLFQGVFSVVYCLFARRRALLAVLCPAWLAVGLLWLPWFDLFKQAAAVRTASFYVAREPSLWWPVWAVVGRIPYNWMVFLSGKQVVAYAVPIYATSVLILLMAACATLPGIMAGLPGVKRFLPGESSGEGAGVAGADRVAVAFLWCWALVPALCVWLTDVLEGHRVVEIARYVMATAPAVYVLCGAGLAAYAGARPPDRRSPWVWILGLHVACALINNAYTHAVPHREPWREMARLVEERAADDLVLVSQPYDIVCLDRYLSRPVRQIGVTPALPAERLIVQLAGRKRFWLVTAQEGEAIKDMVPARFRLMSQIDLHHALHLRLYEEPAAAGER